MFFMWMDDKESDVSLLGAKFFFMVCKSEARIASRNHWYWSFRWIKNFENEKHAFFLYLRLHPEYLGSFSSE